MKGRKEEGGEGGGKGRVEVTRRAGRRGGKSAKMHGGENGEGAMDSWGEGGVLEEVGQPEGTSSARL